MELQEDKWSGAVDTKKKPPEGLFANGTVDEIVSWLKGAHASLKTAMSSLNFYINRAGKNLSNKRKAELARAKDELRAAFGVAESMSFMQELLTASPLREADEDGDDDDDDDKVDADMDDLMDKYMDSQKMYSFEGPRGVRNLEKLVKVLGYSDMESFLIDNPGAIEAIIEFVKDQNNTEWKEALRSAANDE